MLPHLSNGRELSADSTLIILEAGCEQTQVQFLERGHIWDGYEKISATKPNCRLNTTFLPPGGWLAEMALEQVIGAKGYKALVLPASFPSCHQLDSCREVIIADAPGHAPEVLERAGVPVEEALLFLAGKSHDKSSPAVRQPHHKHLYRLPHSGDDRDGLPPIDLCILTRFKLQRQKECRGFVVLVPLGEVQAHPRLAALVALRLEDFKDLVRGVLLLAGKMVILGEQRVRSRLEGTEHRCSFRLAESVGLRRQILDRLVNGFAGVPLFARNLPLAFPVEVEGSANGFSFFHGNHLQFSYR